MQMQYFFKDFKEKYSELHAEGQIMTKKSCRSYHGKIEAETISNIFFIAEFRFF